MDFTLVILIEDADDLPPRLSIRTFCRCITLRGCDMFILSSGDELTKKKHFNHLISFFKHYTFVYNSEIMLLIFKK